MTQNTRFITTCIALLFVAWAVSGERLLDAVFAMPDIGPLDDAVISTTLALEDQKTRLGLPDLFGAVRTALHQILGL